MSQLNNLTLHLKELWKQEQGKIDLIRRKKIEVRAEIETKANKNSKLKPEFWKDKQI